MKTIIYLVLLSLVWLPPTVYKYPSTTERIITLGVSFGAMGFLVVLSSGKRGPYTHNP